MKNPDVYDVIVSNHVLANCRPALLEKFTICYFTENVDPTDERAVFADHNACYYVQDKHGALFIPVFPELFEKHNPINKDDYISFDDEETVVVRDDSGSFRIEFSFGKLEDKNENSSLISCIQMSEDDLLTDVGETFLVTEVNLQMYIVFRDNIDEVVYGCMRYENYLDNQLVKSDDDEQNYINNMITIAVGSCTTSEDRLCISELELDKSSIKFYIVDDTPSEECAMYFYNILPSLGIHQDDIDIYVNGHVITLTLFKDNIMYHDFNKMVGFSNTDTLN